MSVVHPPMVFGGNNAPPPILARPCWMPDSFACPECRTVMACENDYASGSNHYWTLRCPTHGRYTTSTYRHGGHDGMVPRQLGSA